MNNNFIEDYSHLLHNNEDFQRIASALALSQGFQFTPLVCQTPRTLKAALPVLINAASAEREQEMSLHLIDPYAGSDLRTEAGYALLRDKGVDRLLAPERREESPDTVYVLDATRALGRDRESWLQVFQYMNLMRNDISRTLPGPLILALRKELLADFANTAGDFWSIRTTVAEVPEIPQEKQKAESWKGSGELIQLQGYGNLSARPTIVAPEHRELHKKIEDARQRVRDTPDSVSAVLALATRLDQLGALEREHGQLKEAKKAYQETVDVLEQQVEKRPDNDQVVGESRYHLLRLGDVFFALGELENADKRFTAALQRDRDRLSRAPGNPVLLRDLSVSLDQVGDVHQARGDLERALEASTESLDIRRTLHARDPDNPNVLRDLSVSLDQVGDVHQACGDLERALEAYTESLDIARTLHARDPDSAQGLADMGVSLARSGMVAEQGNESSAALPYFHEALDYFTKAAAKAPDVAAYQQYIHACRPIIEQLQQASGDGSTPQTPPSDAPPAG